MIGSYPNGAAPQGASSDTTTQTSMANTPPTMQGALNASNITSTGFTVSWNPATDDVGVTGYEYSLNNGAYTSVGSALTVTLSSLTPNTGYNVAVRAYDASAARSTPLTATVQTSSTSGFTPSASRTVQVQATTPAFVAGKFWDMSNPAHPRGNKDPDSTIDITFDWSLWLSDMGNPSIANVQFTLNGVNNAGSYAAGSQATVFVSDGTSPTATVACKITTNTTPPRIDERTIYLTIGDL